MQERGPEDCGQPGQVPWHDAMLPQVATPKQLVRQEDNPAKAGESDERREAFHKFSRIGPRILVFPAPFEITKGQEFWSSSGVSRLLN